MPEALRRTPPPRPAAGRPVLALLLAAGLLQALPARAQETPARQAALEERIDVDLVTVDVWVTDAEGNPVTGLEPGSFRVRHDGEPVPIAHFSEMRAGEWVAGETGDAETPPAPAGGAAAAESHLVFYLDDSRLHPTHVGPLIDGLDGLLAGGAVEAERVLVLRQGRRLEVAVPFGSPAQQVRDTLAGLASAGGGAGGASWENQTRLALEAIDRAWEEAQDMEGAAATGLSMVPEQVGSTGQPGSQGGSPRAVVGGVGGGGGPDACGMFVNQVRPTVDAWVRSRRAQLDLTLANLSDSVGFLAGLPGVKMLLYLSDGLDARPGNALFTYVTSLCPAAGAEVLTESLEAETRQRLLELTRHANANRVTLHALQASGLTSPTAASASERGGGRGGASRRASGSFEASRRASEREGMELIARETGGRTVFNRNDLGPELARIASSARSYYSLAYAPPRGDAAGTAHRIEVELDDASLTARYRRGYLEKSSDRWLGERVEGALNLGITRNPLGVGLGAGAAEIGEEGKVKIPLVVQLPVDRLTFLPRDGGEWIAEVVVKVLARRLDSDALALRDQTFRLRGAPGATGRVDLPVTLELDGGMYLTAVGVRDHASREVSYISTMLDARAGG